MTEAGQERRYQESRNVKEQLRCTEWGNSSPVRGLQRQCSHWRAAPIFPFRIPRMQPQRVTTMPRTTDTFTATTRPIVSMWGRERPRRHRWVCSSMSYRRQDPRRLALRKQLSPPPRACRIVAHRCSAWAALPGRSRSTTGVSRQLRPRAEGRLINHGQSRGLGIVPHSAEVYSLRTRVRHRSACEAIQEPDIQRSWAPTALRPYLAT